MSRPRKPSVELFSFPGLGSGRSVIGPNSPSVRGFASHNDIGLNYIERGWIRALVATGYRYELGPGRLAVFWGAMPHKIEALDPDIIYHWLVLPMGTFLRWRMPSGFTRELLEGRVFFEPDQNEGPFDLAMLNRTHRNISGMRRDADLGHIVLLELEARLRRLAHAAPSPRRTRRLVARGANSQPERILLLVAEHFREPLTIQDIAAAVGMRADYAGRVFRQHMGVGLVDYIIECRLSHAKALLVTTDAKIMEVSQDSGFGSVSQFHAVFQRRCGCTPRAFRAGLHGVTG